MKLHALIHCESVDNVSKECLLSEKQKVKSNCEYVARYGKNVKHVVYTLKCSLKILVRSVSLAPQKI